MNLKGKVVVITGSSSGIGKACAQAFLKEGCSVVLSSRNYERLEKTMRELKTANSQNILIYPADVTSRDAMLELADETVKKFGKIDVWINNAGLGLDTNFIDGDCEEISKVIDTNIKGVIYGSRAAANYMKTNNGKVKGHIINVSSLASRYTFPGLTIYCGTKAAVTRISEGMEVELRHLNIKILNVLPGLTNTRFNVDSLGNGSLLKTDGAGTFIKYITAVNAEVVAKKIVKQTKKEKSDLAIMITKFDKLMMLGFRIFKKPANAYAAHYWKNRKVKTNPSAL